MNEPEACYVPVIPGARWYYATYNVEQGRPVEFFYFREGRGGFNFEATMHSDPEGNIVIEQDHDSGGYGGCGQNSITVEVPVAVMAEFIRQIA